ncbi:hypothetical protein CASFOL_026809 [Castilleja foliolosa]|uniref:Uncharacterized protein n=1 Tax=Castilleja foliolosa TaxID=1961234 RepID=A0ABD3CJD9_9LAMI
MPCLYDNFASTGFHARTPRLTLITFPNPSQSRSSLAIHIPFVYQKIFSGMVSSEDHPIPLPASVCDLPLLDLLLEHFRFSQARGHSQKEIASYQVKLFRELIPALNNLLLREDVKVEEDVEVGTSDLDNKMKLLPIEDDELTTEEEKAIDRDVEYFVSSLNKR